MTKGQQEAAIMSRAWKKRSDTKDREDPVNTEQPQQGVKKAHEPAHTVQRSGLFQTAVIEPAKGHSLR